MAKSASYAQLQVKRSFRSSLAYRLCPVAEGRFDGKLTLRDAWEWDIAAGALIAERAGAMVTDRAGASLRFNAQHPQAARVVVVAPGLHGALAGGFGPRRACCTRSAWPGRWPRPRHAGAAPCNVRNHAEGGRTLALTCNSATETQQAAVPKTGNAIAIKQCSVTASTAF
jgi:hypothetical protein